MRYAVRFAYDGTRFYGHQRQVSFRTVEGDIINALSTTGVIDDADSGRFESASRTDRGVSALGNVIAFDTEYKKDNILRILNAKTKDMWHYGITEVDEDFNPRHAVERWYRYFLWEEYDVNALHKVSSLFAGTHDFRNFAKISGRRTVRTINSVDISYIDRFIVVDIRGESFLWNQVRRIMGAVLGYECGEIDIETVRAHIDCTADDSGKAIPPAPPEPLVLMDVVYRFDIPSFISEPSASRLLEKVEKEIFVHNLAGYFFRDLKDRISL